MSAAAQTYNNNISDIFDVFEFGWSYFMAYASSAFCFFSIAAIILTKKYCSGRCCGNSYSYESLWGDWRDQWLTSSLSRNVKEL